MAEYLNCYQDCPPANGGIRPCARQIYNNPGGVCAGGILSDPAVQKLHPASVNVTMDNLINHQVTIEIDVEKKEGVIVKKTVGFVEMGKVIPASSSL